MGSKGQSPWGREREGAVGAKTPPPPPQPSPSHRSNPLTLNPLGQRLLAQHLKIPTQHHRPPRGQRPVQPRVQPFPRIEPQPRQNPRPRPRKPEPRRLNPRPLHNLRRRKLPPGDNQRRPLRIHRRERHEPIPLPRHLHGVVQEPARHLRKPSPQRPQRKSDPLPTTGPSRVQRIRPAHHHIRGSRITVHVGNHPHGRTREQPHSRLPVRGQQQRDPIPGPRPKIPLQQIGGLGHPIGEGGHGQFDTFPGGIVVEGHEGTPRIRGERGTQQVGRGAIGGIHPSQRTRAGPPARPAHPLYPPPIRRNATRRPVNSPMDRFV
ncbi:hypothetical protein GA0115233_109413 [Streptomyces sp. DI166]|nr:hypothetical protein GA0115233_109413 [Streptomyces sp. DI166]